MPSVNTPSRPPITSRHSTNSVHFARSPGDSLSSSAQKAKGQKHVVGQGRLGPRIPSYGRNVNKLAKVPSAYAPQTSSPRPGHVKRNSSNTHLPKNVSQTSLRQNHSETSLKKNRSNVQLVKLHRPVSSRNVSKAIKPLGKSKRSSSHIIKAPEGPINPTVRFDLGDEEEDDDDEETQEDGWTNESASQSPSTTRSNTRRNSMVGEPSKLHEIIYEKENQPPDKPPDYSPNRALGVRAQDSPTSPRATESQAVTPSRHSETDQFTSRLLKRNVSFNAPPKMSDVKATVNFELRPPFLSTINQSGSLSNDQELISRFIEPGTSSGTPAESNFPPDQERRTNDSPDREEPRRNKSVPNLMRRDSASSSSLHSGTVTPTAALPSSRTQQKLWLDRASSNIEPQHTQPIGLLRSNRLSSAALPRHNAESGEIMHPQLKLRHLIEQTSVEYRRVRLYRNPLAEAFSRLQATKLVPSTRVATTSRAKGSHHDDSSNGNHALGRSWQSQQSMKAPAASEIRKSRVLFKDSGDREDRESEKDKTALKTNVRGPERTQREEVHEVCRRIWERQTDDE